MPKRNFLLGKGERLTEVVKVPSGGAPKIAPYTFDEAKTRLQPMLKSVASDIKRLPDYACPDDFAIAKLTLNPEYIAKSYYPSDLLRTVGLEAVGSKSVVVKPEKKSRERTPEDTITTEVFVIGKRQAFERWASEFSNWSEASPGANQIVGIEDLSFPSPDEKIKEVKQNESNIVYEVVLHVNENAAENRYLGQFQQYLKRFDITPSFERRFYAGGLSFVEVEAPSNLAKEIAQFSLVRVVRAMPSLRLLRPTIRSGSKELGRKITLPSSNPLDSATKVAIFDGGVPQDHPITKWVTPYEIQGVGPADPELYEHGVGVSSAFLFGYIDPKKSLEKPFSYADHYRVLDNVPGQNPYELYEILDRINNVLKTKHYDFINLSLGPRLPIEDDDIHAWTAVLDEHLSSGNTLATIAVGNDGEGDPAINANRIQVPADCVNALSIGACDVPDDNWQRAPYSSVGPGRSLGLIKPDLVDFGESVQRPFLTLDATEGNTLVPTGGTSFSSPTTLRLAAGVRAHFGTALSPLAIRTLLVHCSEQTQIPHLEVGWGRVARSIEEIVICNDNVMRVVFQGTISPSKYMRAPIPLPLDELKGMVKIKATLCYASATDPHHPGNYTRCGLEVFFRPNKTNVRDNSIHASTKSFFGKSHKGKSEDELRKDAWKWENCLHTENKYRGSTLNEPVLDIHYNARSEGHNDSHAEEIKYALVITVEAPKVADLYDQVVRRYATQLEALQPIIDIPVRV